LPTHKIKNKNKKRNKHTTALKNKMTTHLDPINELRHINNKQTNKQKNNPFVPLSYPLGFFFFSFSFPPLFFF